MAQAAYLATPLPSQIYSCLHPCQNDNDDDSFDDDDDADDNDDDDDDDDPDYDDLQMFYSDFHMYQNQLDKSLHSDLCCGFGYSTTGLASIIGSSQKSNKDRQILGGRKLKMHFHCNL